MPGAFARVASIPRNHAEKAAREVAERSRVEGIKARVAEAARPKKRPGTKLHEARP